MLKHYLSQLILLPLILLVTSWAQAETSFSRVYVFGDSLSDTGNLASVVGGFPAPYYMNRVSNGPVAVETLAAQLGHTAEASLHLIGPAVGSNYAVAGANAYGDEVIDLNTQVISFYANHGYIAPADALYVIFIGGNDVRSVRDEPDMSIARSIVYAAASEVGQAMVSLIQAGAQSFMLINSANIGIIPETQLIADVTSQTELLKHSRKLSQFYRVALHETAEQLKELDDVNIIEFDLFKYLNKVVKKADTYGFSNATDACFYLETMTFHPDCNYGLNADQFIFFDEIHPSTRAHTLIGEAVYEALVKKTN